MAATSAVHPSGSVAVIIPCFNHGQFLPHAIASVLRQTYPFVECVVVSDGSTDDTVAVATRFGVRVIEQLHRGVSEARNAGLAAVRSEFVVFLDADDELLPDAVAHGVGLLNATPSAGAVAGRCQVIASDGQPLSVPYAEITPSAPYEGWLSQNFVWTPGAAVFRRATLEAMGGFPIGLGPAADYAVYLALARDGSIQLTTEPMVRYRQHHSNMSRNPVLMLRDTLAVLRREQEVAPLAIRRQIGSKRKVWCEWYGEQIVDQLRTDWHAGRRGLDQLLAMMALLRHCREVALRHLWRKMRLTMAVARKYVRGVVHRGATARRRV